MKNKLLKLQELLTNNGYTKEADKIADFIQELDNENELSDAAKIELKAMCTPKHLGDLRIREFNRPTDWWNFLASVVMGI